MHDISTPDSWPIGAALEHLPHLVGDFAARAGKSATLAVAAAPVAVSDQIIAAALPAIVQVLRNAVAHGIESPAGRAAAGKVAAGTIRLDAAERDGRLLVQISDDGCGADLDRLPDLALLRGLSIVKARLATVGGMLELDARAGSGTTVSLSIPLPHAAAARTLLAEVA